MLDLCRRLPHLLSLITVIDPVPLGPAERGRGRVKIGPEMATCPPGGFACLTNVEVRGNVF